MEIGVLGVNHKSCPLYLREALTKAFEKVFGQREIYSGFSYVLLSTCNRVEIYFAGQEIAHIHGVILSFLRKKMQLVFEHVLYSYFGEDVFLHLVKVSSGLDSALVGESDVQRQVKLAYEKTRIQSSLSSLLHYLFQKSLHISKHVRSFYNYAKRGSQLEDILLLQIKTLLKDLSSKKVLFIGNSQMNRKILALVITQPFGEVMLYSRRGVDVNLLKRYPSLKMHSDRCLQNWQGYDVVISATKQDGYILTKSHRTTDEKVLMFDLSIPRSLDPALAKTSGVILLNIEDLVSLFKEKKRCYQQELQACEKAIENSVEACTRRYREKQIKKALYMEGSYHLVGNASLDFLHNVS